MKAQANALKAKASAYGRKAALITGTSMVSGLAMAQTAGIDTAAVESSFGNLETALATVGGLIIGAAALAITFKWVKGMIFS
ncbi:MAG TPA: hypothetical protein DIW42_04640 [Alcanivorax sp.]|jgi:2,3-bisphosphoglycerate-independent phosphoglycerate mutase|nr:hypothetical protein [Alcanivorax sp.]